MRCSFIDLIGRRLWITRHLLHAKLSGLLFWPLINQRIPHKRRLSSTARLWQTLLRPNDVSRSDFIFHLRTFLPRTVIAARRRSGVPSKVYQWLRPRCRHIMTLKQFANRSPNFTGGGSKSAKFGLYSQKQSPLKSSSFETE